MKKADLLVISLLLLSLFSTIISVSAQEAAPGLEGAPLVGEIQAGQQQYEQFTTAENKSTYLKQEWAKILEKHKILGPIFKVINSVFVFLNPFFKMVLGYESTLSWGFVFAVIIWLTLFFFINPITSQLFNNGWFGMIGAFAIASLIGVSGVIKKAVEMLEFMISNIWIAIISLVLGVVLIILFERIGKMIKLKMKKAKLAEEERKTAEAQKITQAAGEVAKEELKSFKEK